MPRRQVVLGALLAVIATVAAIAAPLLSPEISVDAPVYGPASGVQGFATACAGGSGYLVVWDDAREGSASGNAIYATRVDANGAVLDPYGIRVGTFAAGFNWQIPQGVAFDGTNWLVVYTGRKGTATGVYGTRVSQAGVVLDPGGFLIAASGYAPKLAFGGGNYLVIWEDTRNAPASHSNVYGARVSPSGAVLDPAGINLTPTNAWRSGYDLAFDGTNYLLAYGETPNSGGTIAGRARFITQAGTLVGTAAFPISTVATGQSYFHLSFDGTNYLATWYQSGADVYGGRISTAGALLDGPGFLILGGTGSQVVWSQTFDGTNHWLGVEDSLATGVADSKLVRVAPSGAVLDPSGTLLMGGADEQIAPALAARPGQIFAAVTSAWRSGGSARVWGMRVSSSGTVLDTPILLSRGANGQTAPAVAYDGTQHLVAWEDDRNGSDAGVDLYAIRIGASGAPIEPSAFPLTSAPSWQMGPTLASHGSGFMAAWLDARHGSGELFAARVSSTGQVLDPQGLPVVTAPTDGGNFYSISDPRLACFGGQCALAYRQLGARMVRVSAAGGVLDPVPLVLGNNSSARLAANDAGYLLAWANGTRLEGRFVDRTGAITPPPPADPYFLAQGSFYGSALIHDGEKFWVITEGRPADAGTPTTQFDIYAAPYANGALGAPVRLTQGTLSRFSVSATFAPAGPYILVSWLDTRGSTDGGLGLYAARLSLDGGVLDPGGFPVASPSTPFMTPPATAPVSAAAQLFAYSRLEPAAPYTSPRVRLVRANLAPLGSACTSSDACGSGFCVDGVCCENACGNGSTSDCQACSVSQGSSANGRCVALQGTVCSDGNACTKTDTCELGACVGKNPVVCVATGPCVTAGLCSGATGVCSMGMALPDGTTCPGGACRAGACIPPPPDAGTDAGVDAGVKDAGAPFDGGNVDAGPNDAGAIADAGPGDAGSSQDAGLLTDAGSAGAPDAGAQTPPPQGCGCGAGGEGWSTAALLGLLALARGRRLRRTHPDSRARALPKRF